MCLGPETLGIFSPSLRHRHSVIFLIIKFVNILMILCAKANPGQQPSEFAIPKSQLFATIVPRRVDAYTILTTRADFDLPGEIALNPDRQMIASLKASHRSSAHLVKSALAPIDSMPKSRSEYELTLRLQA